MNARRRKEITRIADAPEELMNDLREVYDEEMEAYDNLPESIQMSERGEDVDDNLSVMDGFLAELESGIDDIRQF